MGDIYQWTFFLALGLLAIVITIFVVAVSLLGRAMEAAVRSENEKLVERKANNAEEMATIKKEMEDAESSGQVPRGLARKLDKLEKRDKKFERELSKIRKAPELLTVKGGVVPSSASLLGALILSGAAWYLSNIQIFIWIIPVLIWILGLAAIGYSICRIYKSLRVIESVAVTSEEAALVRETVALKTALGEAEKERKPGLALIFKRKKFPLHIKADSELTLDFSVYLIKGEEAIEPSVYFIVPPAFSFPGRETHKQDADHPSIPNYVTTKVSVVDVHRKFMCPGTVILKAPAEVNTFTLFYQIVCRGFSTERLKFQVVVE